MGCWCFTGLASSLPDVELGTGTALGLTTWFGLMTGLAVVAVFGLVMWMGERCGVDTVLFSDLGG